MGVALVTIHAHEVCLGEVYSQPITLHVKEYMCYRTPLVPRLFFYQPVHEVCMYIAIIARDTLLNVLILKLSSP